MRKTLKIKEIPKFNYDEAYSGDLESSPNSDEFGKVGLGDEFNCDMYWPLLNMYWENSGFGLGGF